MLTKDMIMMNSPSWTTVHNLEAENKRLREALVLEFNKGGRETQDRITKVLKSPNVPEDMS